MAIYYCPSCNKKYFLDCDIDESFENDFKCEFCGYSKYSNKSKQNNVHIEKQTTNTKQNDELLKIEYQKLDLLRNIHKMMKFFYVTSIAGIVLLIISFLLELGSL